MYVYPPFYSYHLSKRYPFAVLRFANPVRIICYSQSFYRWIRKHACPNPTTSPSCGFALPYLKWYE